MIESSGGSLTALSRLTRPRLLVSAARAGLSHYDRARDLGRILHGPVPATGSAALAALISEEADADARRRANDASYDVARHVELLIAMMGEARLVPARAVTIPAKGLVD